ncbi:YceI family protein [Myxococcus landrumensis]|uniref:YceI family protein n=1 Tax=Myxococcus landrumensis TaxID=2813577 RepID=A0ABX7NDZ3_9BACT|nr:YceI family protein [Myxococcus landrumus]QSQ17042.1 YceI family protein [Myxococcus landrumus]
MSIRAPALWAALVAVFSSLSAQAAEPRAYHLAARESTVRLHVGKSGMLKTFGHEHEVAAPAFSGQVMLPDGDLSTCQVSARFESRALQVLPGHESAKDVPKIQATMLGPEVLDAERYPDIRFTSKHCTVKQTAPGVYEAQVDGELALHGVAKPVSLPMKVELSGDRLVARGSTTIRQTDFGIRPVSAGGGSVKVKNEVPIQLTLVGHAGAR